MEKWKLAICNPETNDGASFFLLNKTKTLVKVHKRINFDPLQLFKRLEDIKFPFKYTDGIEVINFTVLTESSNAAGYYMYDKIWVDVSQRCIDYSLGTLIHEIGHHVDESENISPELHQERMLRAKHLHEPFSRSSDDEYLATGFEKFYTEKPEEKRELRKKNPVLYRTIQLLHREYRKK